jgi:8-oxo-dGTP pyrophosphatase MutT (NUDIX family)
MHVAAMRLAATVILARDAQPGIEVLLLRRTGHSTFAPLAFVFPGGAVEDKDRAADPEGWDEERLGREFRAKMPMELRPDQPRIELPDARALVNAAVRELYEEARIKGGTAGMHLFSHWITPPTEPRRFNTHFFVMRAPEGQVATPDRKETRDAAWMKPAEALQRADELNIVYPTVKHLERLRAFRDVDTLLSFAQEKPILTIMPNCSPSEGFIMPRALEGRW